jgi:uncharacterized lipoprotein YmbA
MLRSLPTDASSPATQGAGGPVLVLGPVKVAAYLDRPQMVTKGSGSEVKLSEFERWAEPLMDNIRTVLANDLSVLVPTDRISFYPARLPPDVDLRIAVEVLRFDGSLGGDAVLEARWTFFGSDAEGPILTKRSRFEHATGGPGYEPFVEALNRALEALSRELAQEIRRATRSN